MTDHASASVTKKQNISAAEADIIPPPGRTLIGLRLSALVEIALFMGLAIAVDFGWLGGNRFANLEPNPLWLVILLISSQYGTHEGFFATLIATLYLLAGNIPEPKFGQDRFDYIFFLAKTPILWFFCALLIGELRTRHIRERDTLRRYLVESRLREEEITKAYMRIHRAKDRLETRVVGQSRTVVSYFKAAQTMDWSNPDSVMVSSTELTRVIMGASAFSLFLLKNDRLEMVFQEGWDEQEYPFKTVFNQSFPIFQAVIGRQHTLVIADATDRLILEREGVLAGPLINQENGNIIGMLKIERMEFSDMNISNVENFKALCEWIGASYDKALQLMEARANSVIHADYPLYTKGFLFRQVQILSHLGQRLGFDLCLIVIHLENHEEITLEEMRQIPQILNEVVGLVMRKTDMVFDYEQTGVEFALLLPATPASHLPTVQNKLYKALQEYPHPLIPKFSFEISGQTLFEFEMPS
ncbi:MAG: GAF domain-containing protein [Magnetococcus sp. YQC-5]